MSGLGGWRCQEIPSADRHVTASRRSALASDPTATNPSPVAVTARGACSAGPVNPAPSRGTVRHEAPSALNQAVASVSPPVWMVPTATAPRSPTATA
jgi:hypothetical protein